MNWGTGIGIVIAVFILMTLGFVTIAMRQNVDLVAEDYYEQDLDYEMKIEQARNARNTATIPDVRQDETGCIRLDFPAAVAGSVFLYRASDKILDMHKSFQTDTSGKGQVCPENFPPGAWKIYLTWQYQGLDCYSEHSLMVHK